MWGISKRGIFMIRNSICRSSAARHEYLFNFSDGRLTMMMRSTSTRASFSSIHQPQDGNWGVDDDDDIRKGAHNNNNEDGIYEKDRSTGDMAKEGVRKSMESGIEFGEKAKETMDIAWDGFKDTTNKVKDAIVEEDDYYMIKKDHEATTTNLNNDEEEEDSHIHNLRKRAGGYDLKDKH